MYRFFILFFAVLFTSASMAQGVSPKQGMQEQVSGTVSSEGGETLPGVSIRIIGGTSATLTNAEGKFSIAANEGASLVFSYIGFAEQEVTISTQNTLDVILMESNNDLDEVVVVGYGSQSKATVSGAVAEVKTDQLTSRSMNSFTEALQGKAPGVTVTSEGGDPTGTPRVNIRGVGGINGENPLYVVDGALYPGVPALSPNDIESISVLKDASAAIYGARASGGVILITTKKGLKDHLAISLDAKYGIQSPWKKLESLNASEFAQVSNLAADNAGMERNAAFDSSVYPEGQITRTNWLDEIFRNAATQEYNVSINGGGEKSTLFSSFNYRNAEGILLNTYSRRYNLRLNSSHQLTDWLKVGENVYYSSTNGNTANTTSGYTGALIAAMFYPPSIPVYNENGAFSGLPADYAGAYGDVINPVAYLKRLDISNPINTLNINPYAEVTFLNDFKFRSNLAITKSASFYKEFQTKVPEIGKIFDSNRLNQSTFNNLDFLTEQTLSYDRRFDKHHFDVLAGFTYQKTTNEGFSVYAQGFDDESAAYRYLGNAQQIFPSESYKNASALISYLGRLNYDYNSKYMLSLIGRRDGSSLVHKDNRFQNYGSVSGAWLLSEEGFMQDISWLNALKLRASYGVLGNLGSLTATSVNPLLQKGDIYMGENPALSNGYYEDILGNSNLTWANSKQRNIGLDLAVLQNRLSLNADVFKKETDQMIIQRSLSGTTGVSSQWINGGKFQDKGIELGINVRGNSSAAFQYNVNATLTSVSSKLLSLSEGIVDLPIDFNVRSILDPIKVCVGQPLYSYYLVQTDGIFKSPAEVDAYKNADGGLIQPNALPGDLRFKDINDDGQINNDDRVFSGSAYPDFSYGLSFNASYKQFDFNIFAQGVHGNKLFNAMKYTELNAASGQNYNKSKAILGAWSPENINSDIPRISAKDDNGNFSTSSDFYLESGSYLRVKNVTLGYNLSQSALQRVKFENVRFYLTANNLLTFSKYSGFDPEVGMNQYGVDLGRYPQARSFMLGVNVAF